MSGKPPFLGGFRAAMHCIQDAVPRLIRRLQVCFAGYGLPRLMTKRFRQRFATGAGVRSNHCGPSKSLIYGALTISTTPPERSRSRPTEQRVKTSCAELPDCSRIKDTSPRLAL